MSSMKEEYTDRKGVRHRVEHVSAAEEDTVLREQLIEDLLRALTQSIKESINAR